MMGSMWFGSSMTGVLLASGSSGGAAPAPAALAVGSDASAKGFSGGGGAGESSALGRGGLGKFASLFQVSTPFHPGRCLDAAL